MALFSEQEILTLTTNKYAECSKSDPEECDRVVSGIIETLRNEGNVRLAIEVAGNIATAELRHELIGELQQELAIDPSAPAA